LKSLVRELVESGAWQGVTLIAPHVEPSDSPVRHGDPKLKLAGRSRSFRPAAHGKIKTLGKTKNGNGHRKSRD